jgi:hypothetical protein
MCNFCVCIGYLILFVNLISFNLIFSCFQLFGFRPGRRFVGDASEEQSLLRQLSFADQKLELFPQKCHH